MAAPTASEIGIEPLYFHIWREVKRGPFLIDDQDFQTFTGFLKDYFSDADDLEYAKKTFEIRGRTFIGTPHRPQNFFQKAELIAYKLEPNRFDLVIKEIVHGELEKIIRALSTRYAIYFNKKYAKAGPLFEGPCISQQIKNLPSLSDLIHNLNSDFLEYSSYPEYIGQRTSKWIRPHSATPHPETSDQQPPNKDVENLSEDKTIDDHNKRDELKNESVDIADINKRAFLKLIGAGGIAFVLSTLFTKKTGNLILGKPEEANLITVQNSAGNIINPAEHYPTDNYKISETDYGIDTYYGFIDRGEGWYIMKEDLNSGTYRYTKGDTSFQNNWQNRKNLKYDTFNRVFSL